jgi:antitoxin (DNA-binding transcriptional repressor) of toxin-antitoxin stability system
MSANLPDNVSDMKKIPSREFQRRFSKVGNSLKPGEVVQVTKDGKPFFQVTKLGRRRIETPNFAKRVAAHPYPAEVGEALLAHLDEALS